MKRIYILLFIILFALTFCSRIEMASEKECLDAHLHNVKLLADDETKPADLKALMMKNIINPKLSEAMIQGCKENKTKKQVQCELATKNYNELSLCQKYMKQNPEN